jgi:hypothetical protein
MLTLDESPQMFSKLDISMPYDYNVTVQSNVLSPIEPSLRFQNGTQLVDTLDIRTQLGVTSASMNLTTEERGNFRLDISEVDAQIAATPNLDMTARPTFPWLWQNLYSGLPNLYMNIGFGLNTSFDIPFAMEYTNFSSLNMIQSRIIEDVLNETSNPAVALQTLLTNGMRMAYYDYVNLFDHTGTSTARISLQEQIPLRHIGLIVVLVFATLHWILGMILLGMFCWSTKYSSLNNSWTAILQVTGSEVEELYGEHAYGAKLQARSSAKESKPELRRVRLMPAGDLDRRRLL